MTDTGAHHLDIAQWGAGMQYSGPEHIEGQATYPQSKDGYNVATDYHVKYRYANGVELEVLDTPQGDYNRDGVMFEGDEGRIFVNRGTIAGRPVEALSTNPFSRQDFRIYDNDNLDRPELSGKIDAIKNHMGNFYDCTLSRKTPISSVQSQHRSVSLCHLGNIAMRLGRPLKWNSDKETFLDDAEANTYLRREQRHGFEVT